MFRELYSPLNLVDVQPKFPLPQRPSSAPEVVVSATTNQPNVPPPKPYIRLSNIMQQRFYGQNAYRGSYGRPLQGRAPFGRNGGGRNNGRNGRAMNGQQRAQGHYNAQQNGAHQHNKYVRPKYVRPGQQKRQSSSTGSIPATSGK